MIVEHVPLPRRCSDCGALNLTVMRDTGAEALVCRRCWDETTRIPQVRQPATSTIDRYIEAREAGR